MDVRKTLLKVLEKLLKSPQTVQRLYVFNAMIHIGHVFDISS